MARDLIVRGIDDKTHAELGEVANQIGVSINSIVKDAVDKWLRQQSLVTKKHSLILYADEDSVLRLLRSVDRLAKEGEWFLSFCGPPAHKVSSLLTKLKWYNGTITPYNPTRKNVAKYCDNVIKRIAKEAGQRELCCVNFVIGDIAKASLEEAIQIEEAYDKNRMPGLMFCAYNTETLLGSGTKDMIDLLSKHDQIFIVKEDQLYKLHVTEESVHKLFLS
ncbi:MAG: hypothetical protein QXU32_13130 [Nitrososphaerales archaeon]